MSEQVTLNVQFQMTKNVDDYESIKVQGGITRPIQIESEEDYAEQFNHWFNVVQSEVVDAITKYSKAIQKIKLEKHKKKRDDLE